jgi:hypothetical protein
LRGELEAAVPAVRKTIEDSDDLLVLFLQALHVDHRTIHVRPVPPVDAAQEEVEEAEHDQEG